MKRITTGNLKSTTANEHLPARILNYLRSLTPRFSISREAAKVYDFPAKEGKETGWLEYEFRLSDLKARIDHKCEIDDTSILTALDTLAVEKSLYVLEINFEDRRELDDFRFKVVLGVGVREKHFPYDHPVLQTVSWLNPAIDYPSSHIEIPSKVFNSLIANRTARINKLFGKVDIEIEAQLHREELRELAKFKKLLQTSDDMENNL